MKTVTKTLLAIWIGCLSTLSFAQLDRVEAPNPLQESWSFKDPSSSVLLLYQLQSIKNPKEDQLYALWVNRADERIIVVAKRSDAHQSTMQAQYMTTRPVEVASDSKQLIPVIYSILTGALGNESQLSLDSLEGWIPAKKAEVQVVQFRNLYPRKSGPPILAEDVLRDRIRPETVAIKAKGLNARVSLTDDDLASFLLSGETSEVRFTLQEIVASSSIMNARYYYSYLNQKNLALQLEQEANSFQIAQMKSAVLSAIKMGNPADIDKAVDQVVSTWRLSFASMGYRSEAEMREELRSLIEGASKLPDLGMAVASAFFDSQNDASVFSAQGYEKVEGTPPGYHLYRKKTALGELVGKRSIKGSAHVWTGTIDGKPVKFVTDIDKKGIEKAI